MKRVKILSLLAFLFGLFAVSSSSALPTLLEPANSDACVETSTMFKWNSLDSAVRYVLLLSSDMDFPTESPETFVDTLNTQSDTTLASEILLDGGILKTNSFYYWKVVAIGGNGQRFTSDIFSFHTRLSEIVLISPVNDVCCLERHLQFKVETEYASLDSFRLLITADTAMTDIIIDTLIANPLISSGIINITVDLPFNAQTYYWAAYQNASDCWSIFNIENQHNFCTKAGAPDLLTPEDASQGTPLFENGMPFEVTLNWSPVEGALYYTGYYSETQTFGASTEFGTTDTSFTFTLPDEYNKTYFWKVFAKTDPVLLVEDVLDSCSSEMSEIFMFKTPIEPVLLNNPTDSSTCVPMITNVGWDTVAVAANYHLQVATSSDFADTTIVLDNANIGGVTATIAFPKGITSYWWRVRVKNTDNIGLWSNARMVTTTAETPGAILPLNGSTGNPLQTTFSWDAGKTGSSYRLLLSETDDFKELLVDTNLTLNTFTFVLPNYDTKFYWKVMATYGVCPGAWSSTFNFKTYIAPPTLKTPVKDTTMVEPVLVIFEWTGAPGTVSYDYDIANDSLFQDIHTFERNKNSTWLRLDNLEENSSYWWRVRGENAQGTSEWSEVWHFTTGIIRPNAPILISPKLDYTKVRVDTTLFTWEPSERADEYKIVVSESSDFANLIIDDTTTVTLYTFSGFDNATTYFWKVGAINAQGMSNYSNVWSFKTLPTIPTDTVNLLEPADESINLLTGRQTFKWETIPNIDSYEIWLSENADFSTLLIQNNKVWINQYVNQIEKLKGLTTYYWKVRGVNDAGNSPWSETWSFTTEDPASVSFTDYFDTHIVPSPVRSQANVTFTLNEASAVTFEILDLNGNIVLTQNFTQMQAGSNNIKIDASAMASGTYFFRLESMGKTEFGKFVVNK
ncbi:MAG: hypothetical protein A2X64_00475 [Ignavibacteria bacterium GWF2_33_9]|nr:MAG: hypothetical protein A2X64_00475 [Ignavibacteria bacterium GWF2_33_9]